MWRTTFLLHLLSWWWPNFDMLPYTCFKWSHKFAMVVFIKVHNGICIWQKIELKHRKERFFLGLPYQREVPLKKKNKLEKPLLGDLSFFLTTQLMSFSTSKSLESHLFYVFLTLRLYTFYLSTLSYVRTLLCQEITSQHFHLQSISFLV